MAKGKNFGGFGGGMNMQAMMKQATVEELMQVPGVGENAATLLSSLVSVFSVYQRDGWR